MNTLDILRTAAGFFLICVMGLICFPICFIILLLPERYRLTSKLFFFLADIFYKTVCFALFLPITVTGKEHLKKSEPAIIVANHQSSIDIPLVGSLCDGYQHIWFVLQYYSHHPIIGFLVRRMNVSVDRAQATRAAGSLIKLLALIEKYPRNVIIFPEGRRTNDGKIHDFYQGFAILAKKTGLPVVPVLMPFNYKVFPYRSWYVRYHTLRVIVGEPLIFNEAETEAEFTRKVHDWFTKNLNTLV